MGSPTGLPCAQELSKDSPSVKEHRDQERSRPRSTKAASALLRTPSSSPTAVKTPGDGQRSKSPSHCSAKSPSFLIATTVATALNSTPRARTMPRNSSRHASRLQTGLKGFSSLSQSQTHSFNE